ncbi:MAG: hypothetical protein Fur0018_08000 [Anaerolineales bacterium]
MTAAWYVLRSKVRKEELVYRQAAQRGLQVFYPRLRVNPVNPRARKVRPYFPGYMFVYVDLDEVGVSMLQWMPHSLGLVQFGGEPATVPENFIHAIRRRTDEIAEAGGEQFVGVAPGDVVHIQDGPFRGYDAIFDARVPGSERVRVLLQFLNDRKVPVELQAGHIAAHKKR